MNKRDHIVTGVLVGISVGALLSPTWDAWMIHSIVAVTVPVTLGVFVSDVVGDVVRNRNTLHTGVILGGVVAFPFVFGTLKYVWIGVFTHILLDHFGAKRGITTLYPFKTGEWNRPIGAEIAKLVDERVALTDDIPLLDDENVLEQRHPSWLNWGDTITVAVGLCVFGLLSLASGSIVLGLLFVVGAGWMGGTVVLARRRSHYVVTTHRVYIKDGVLRKSTRETRIADIHNLTTDASFLERLTGKGTVRMDSTGFSGLIAVTGIANHEQFANTIRQQQQALSE